ncbi:MAG: pilus assembly protein [Alphaproteobacteria bacterium]|nr:pilus assembly protein [Alphaproteobacteria bacterium]
MFKHMTNRLKAGIGRLRRSDTGASAVEFALVAGPFFYVLGCICETGLMLFTEYVMQNAVQEAGRLVRTGQAASATGTPILTADQFKASICDRVSAIIDCNGKVSVYVNNATNFSTLATAVPNPVTIGKKADGTVYTVVYSPGKTLQAATVIATYDWYFAFPFMNFLGNFDSDKARRIYGLAIFQNEP